MRLISRLLVFFVLLGVLGSGLSSGAHAQQTQVAAWLQDTTPSLTKAVNLPAGLEPQMSNDDCQLVTNKFGITDCIVDTSIGRLANSSTLYADPDSRYTIVGNDNKAGLRGIPHSNLIIKTYPSTNFGSYIGFYRHLTRADLTKELINHTTYFETRYKVSQVPDYFLTYEDCSSDNICKDKKLAINTSLMAFSKNARWMVAESGEGLVRINLDNFNILPFGPRQEALWFSGSASGQLAISNDGQFVAANITYSGVIQPPSLVVYDLSTCDSTYAQFLSNQKTYCKWHDVWNGYRATNASTHDGGVSSLVTLPISLGNLRFVDDGNVSFNVTFDKIAANFKAATYVVTAPGSQLHKLGLLGVGDSYISGEGAFQYVKQTNISPNLCHQADTSYPFLLGASYFDSYESVACSGAVTDDVITDNPDYFGQAKDGLSQKDRDTDMLLAAFKPGYIAQDHFLSNYTPEAALISIGGNDIGFSDIVKKCVLVDVGDNNTCYDTYEERLALLKNIYGQFDTLRDTYQKVKDASPTTRVYVVGYPQIVKPGGNCGLNVHLNKDETEFAQMLIERMDIVVERAAAASGVFYVDAQHALDGFRLCEGSGAGAAVNGFTFGDSAGPSVPIVGKLSYLGQESYHPTVFGDQLLAEAIKHKTDNLKAPMPSVDSSANEPTIDSDDPFLQDLQKTHEAEYNQKNDPNIAPDIIIRGTNTNLSVDGLADDTQLSGSYKVVLHSNPIDLGTVTANVNGDINTVLTVPDNTPTGLHTLHLYGKDFTGQEIDIQKLVYIAASTDDYDGDGVPNAQEQCVIFTASGQDVDQDGIDDTCDPVIGEVPAISASSDKTQATQVLGASTATSEDPSTLQQAQTAPLQASSASSGTQQKLQGATANQSFIQNQADEKQPKQTSKSRQYIWTAIILVCLGLLVRIKTKR